MQLGLETKYIGFFGDDELGQILEIFGRGLTLGPFVGYKIVSSAGFTFEAQFGGAFNTLLARADSGSVSKQQSQSSIKPFFNLNIGWTF